jgi:hypothetical protein
MEAGCRKSFWEPQLVRSTIAFKEEAMLAVSVEGFRSLVWQLSVSTKNDTRSLSSAI